MTTLRRIRLEDASLLREVRLRALADAPTAFTATLEHEAAQPMAFWDDRARRSASGTEATTLLAFSDQRCIGSVTAFRPSPSATHAHLVGMWVAPEARRQGVATRLIRELEGWLRTAGTLEYVELEVTYGNAAAYALYANFGFTVVAKAPDTLTMRRVLLPERP